MIVNIFQPTENIRKFQLNQENITYLKNIAKLELLVGFGDKIYIGFRHLETFY